MVLSLWKWFWDYVRYCYFHYTLITTIIMLEPVERHCFNAFFTLFVSLFLYTTVVYLPGNLAMWGDLFMHVLGLGPYGGASESVSAVA